MSNPYRIIVWGPGGIGKSCIREIALRDDFQLVGVRAFSPDKDGIDAGTLAGIDELGVPATTDVERVLGLDADCVFFCTRDLGGYDGNAEILQILRSGTNVITIHPYHHLEFLDLTRCPSGFVAELGAACADGGSSFHATGIHPEFVCHRLTGTLAGLCTDITSVLIEENWDVSFIGPDYAKMLGFALTPEAAKETTAATGFAYNYCVQNLHGMAAVLGVDIDHTTVDYLHVPATHDFTLPAGWTVESGTVGRFSHVWKGFARAGDTQPFVTIAVNWMLGRTEMLAEGMSPDELYVTTIEGRPSVRVGVDIKSSIASGQYWMVPGDYTSAPGYTATVATMMQAVPYVVTAPPGPVPVVGPRLHWAPDFHDLEHSATAAI